MSNSDCKGMVVRLIKDGHVKSLAQNIYYFHGLDKEIAEMLINNGEGETVASQIHRFVGLDQEIILKLFESGCVDNLSGLSKIYGLDHKALVKKLIEGGYVEYVATHIYSFVRLDKEVALLLIERGYTRHVAEYITSFVALDKEVAKILIQNGYGKQLNNHLDKLTELDQETAYALLKILTHASEIGILISHLDSFTGLNPNDFVEAIRKKGVEGLSGIANHLGKFKNLNLSIAVEIIKKINSGAKKVFTNLGSFTDGSRPHLHTMCLERSPELFDFALNNLDRIPVEGSVQSAHLRTCKKLKDPAYLSDLVQFYIDNRRYAALLILVQILDLDRVLEQKHLEQIQTELNVLVAANNHVAAQAAIAVLVQAGIAIEQNLKTQVNLQAGIEKSRRLNRQIRAINKDKKMVADEIAIFYSYQFIKSEIGKLKERFKKHSLSQGEAERLKKWENRIQILEHDMYHWIREYLVYAVHSEIRHQEQPLKEKSRFLQLKTFAGFDSVDAFLKHVTPEEVRQYLHEARQIFLLPTWDSGYGGKAWANIAEVAEKMWLAEEGDAHLIDQVYDLEHNGGMVFDKRYDLIDNDDVNKRLVKDLLDAKFKANSLSEILNVLRHGMSVSPSLISLEEEWGADYAHLDAVLSAQSPEPVKITQLTGQTITGIAASAGAGEFITAEVSFGGAGVNLDGKILLKPHTTPDDFSAMKSALGIVTTEGGILSHAAITARELGKHAVIVTQAQWGVDEFGKRYVEWTQDSGEKIKVREGQVIRVHGKSGALTLVDSVGWREPERARYLLEEVLWNSATGKIAQKDLDNWMGEAGAKRIINQEAENLLRQELDYVRQLTQNSELDTAYVIGEISAVMLEVMRIQPYVASERTAVVTTDLGLVLEQAKNSRSDLRQRPISEEIDKLLGAQLGVADIPVMRRVWNQAKEFFAEDTRVELLAQKLAEQEEIKKQEIISRHLELMSLDGVDCDYAFLFGGKLAKLGDMHDLSQRKENDFLVPGGFGISHHAYQRFLKESGIENQLRQAITELEGILADTGLEKAAKKQKTEEKSLEIQTIITSAQISPNSGLGEELIKTLRDSDLSEKRLVVRSSAVQEDSDGAAFAGAAETKLNVREAGILQDIKDVFASFWLPRSIEYRHEHHISQSEFLPAVIVQEMVVGSASGVIFSRNPVGKRSEVIINATYGMGEGVVSGELAIDEYRYDTSARREISASIGNKTEMVAHVTDGLGTQKTAIEATLATQRALTAEQVRQLSQIAMNIESYYGYPVDVEFTIEQETQRVVILQVRPITNLRRRR